MTATVTVATATRPTNGTRRPVELSILRSDIVGRLMDLQTLAEEAIDANGYSLQTVLRLPTGPWRQEMQQAHHDTHERLTRLLAEARMAAGLYDGKPERA